MKSVTLSKEVVDYTEPAHSIIEFASLDKHCPSCGTEMKLSISVVIDEDRPVSLWWVCASCETYNGKPLHKIKRALYVSVPGTSHSEKYDYIREILGSED